VIPGLLHKLYRVLNQAVFPPKCLVCGTFFQPPARDADLNSMPADGFAPARAPSPQSQLDRLLAYYLCPACIRGMVGVESPICVCCGLPFKSRQGDDHPCGDCIVSPKKFRIARAPLVYEQILTRVIHCFKYNGKIQLAEPLAELLQTTFRRFWAQDSIDMIMPVPLHIKRLRKRGFNQAYLLVRNWNTAAEQTCSGLSDLRIERDVLVRTVSTTPQSALGRTDRAANIKNAFALTDPDKIIDKRILLVDDVYTTGATVDECARILLKFGAGHVDVLTLARAV
jgi:ComF family protein